jgi:hypothetical protein
MSADCPAPDEVDPLAGGGWAHDPTAVVDTVTVVEDEQGIRFDPATGEPLDVVDAEVVDEPDALSGGLEQERAVMPTLFASQGARAVALFRDPEAVAHLTHDATRSLLHRIEGLAAAAREARPEGTPTASTLQPELTLMADAAETLGAIERVFHAGAVRSKQILGEVVHELADDPRKGSTSVRVGDAHGTDLKVTRTQPTEVRVDEPEVLEVLVASVLGRMDLAGIAKGERAKAALVAGVAVRDALASYRAVAAAHSFKTTALEAYTRRLEAEDAHSLAIRMGHAFGRVPKGEPQVKTERVAPKGASTDG